MIFLKALILDDLIDFFDFWFHHLPVKMIRHFFDYIYFFEKSLKLRVYLRNLTKPLYGDYSLVGYFVAFPYRLIRIFISLIFYFIISVIYFSLILIIILGPLILILWNFILKIVF